MKKGVLLITVIFLFGINLLSSTLVTNDYISVNNHKLTSTELTICFEDLSCDYSCTYFEDCAIKINQAFSLSDRVHLVGSYFETLTPILIGSNQSLYGDGKFKTIIHSLSSSDVVIKNSDFNNGNNGISIHDLGIDGHAELKSFVNADFGIYFSGTSNFHINNIYVTNTLADAINFIGSSNNLDPNSIVSGTIENSNFYKIYREGVQFDYGSNVILFNNRFDLINSRAINFENYVENGIMRNNYILNNVITNTGGGGIAIGNTNGNKTNKDFFVRNNFIYNVRDSFRFGSWNVSARGIELNRVGVQMYYNNIVVEYNVIDSIYSTDPFNYSGDGIYAITGIGSGDFQINHNRVSNTLKDCIHAWANGDYIDNTLVNCGNYGINAQHITGNINFNRIKNSSYQSIYTYYGHNNNIFKNDIIDQNIYSNGSTYSIHSLQSPNSTIKLNTISGSNTTYCIGSFSIDSVVENNYLSDCINDYQIYEPSTYLLEHLYSTPSSGNLSLPPCISAGVFDYKTIFSYGDKINTCYNGSWYSSNLNKSLDSFYNSTYAAYSYNHTLSILNSSIIPLITQVYSIGNSAYKYQNGYFQILTISSNNTDDVTGSINIGRDSSSANNQLVSFGNGISNNFLIGRLKNTDDFVLGYKSGTSLLKRISISLNSATNITNNLTILAQSGSGNAFACFNSQGQLYRSNSSCV